MFEIRLDLRLALGAEGGLVDGEKDHLVVVGQHGAVQATVHSAHILSSELREIMETLLP